MLVIDAYINLIMDFYHLTEKPQTVKEVTHIPAPDSFKGKTSCMRHDKLLNRVTEIACTINREGVIQFINQACCSVWGYTPEEIIGTLFSARVIQEDAAACCAALSNLTGETAEGSFTNHVRSKNGDLIEMDWSVMWDAADGLFYATGRDITARSKAEEMLRTLSLVAKETINAVMITDLDRRIIYTNDSFTRITGYTLEEVRGRIAKDVLRGPDSDKSVDDFISGAVENKRFFQVQILNYKKNGEKYWAEFSAQPMFDNEGKHVGFFSIETDISERKFFEQKLDQEKKERQRQITKAIISTQENERAAIGRELHDNVNQVLTTVKLYNEMCLAEEKVNRNILMKSVQQINYCIELIRDLSKELRSPRIEEMGLTDSIRELADRVRDTQRMAVKYFTYGITDETVSQDLQTAIYRIAQEQLTNVLKYSEASLVEVGLVGSSGSIALHIQDNGKGFNPVERSKGVGIINMITRAEALGGIIDIETSPGKGCALMAEFPLVSPHE